MTIPKAETPPVVERLRHEADLMARWCENSMTHHAECGCQKAARLNAIAETLERIAGELRERAGRARASTGFECLSADEWDKQADRLAAARREP